MITKPFYAIWQELNGKSVMNLAFTEKMNYQSLQKMNKHGHDRLCRVRQKRAEKQSCPECLKARAIAYMPLVTLAPMASAIYHGDLTNRVTTSFTLVGNEVGSLSRGNRPAIGTLTPPRYTRATPQSSLAPVPQPRHRGGRAMDHLLQRLEALEDEVRHVQRRLRRWRQLTGSVLVLALVCLL
jgi:hypothetical protein